MFEAEFEFFIENQDELVQKYAGQVLVIKRREIVGAYPTPMEAFTAASEMFAPGTFMLQPCEPGPSAYTVMIATVNSVKTAA